MGRPFLPPSYIGSPRLPPGAARRLRRFVTTSDRGFTNTRPHLLCNFRSFAAHYLQIVHRTSHIVHGQTPSASVVNRKCSTCLLVHLSIANHEDAVATGGYPGIMGHDNKGFPALIRQ